MTTLTTSTAVIAASGVLSLAIAARAIIAPKALGAALGFAVSASDATNEIRAQYGGFFLAIAVVCGLAVLGLVPATAALLVLFVTFGGVLAGRLIDFALKGGRASYGGTIKALFLVDAVGLAGVALAVTALANAGAV